jgi:2-oxoisovalerate dehydrogenase E2 component (dihydrolipoyl transacylase)
VPQLKQFALPDVGEGLTEGEILHWFVKPGDPVTDGQTIVEIETAKAAVELPCPFDGVVTELNYPEGATVNVGTPIITVDVAPDANAAPDTDTDAGEATPSPATTGMTDDLVPDIPRPSADEPVEPGMIGGPAPGGRTSVLVGYGPRSTVAVRRPRKSTAPAPAPAATPPPADGPALAKPPVRKLAKDLGVDLAGLTGSGPQGAITRADIEGAAATGPVGSVSAGSREQRIPVKGVRKHTATAMVTSAFTAPHVTEFLTIDITPTMELRRKVAALPQYADVKVSPLLFVAKALLLAVRRHPMVNSTWDEERQEIVVKDYVNLGIAAATDRGLIVPNIKDAERLTLRELAAALVDLTDVARSGKTTPADLAGGTISITNVGVFGIDTGTPILPPGEAAILAFGAVREMPWVVDGAIVPRQVTQLAVSFDHRIIDGQLGAEFLADVGAMLADPATLVAFT